MLWTRSDNEADYFAYSASLRIFGSNLPLEEITSTLGVVPSRTRRAGDRIHPTARPYNEDAWFFTAPIREEAELTEHLRCLWHTVEPHVQYLVRLNAKVDVFCGYRSNVGTAGFAVEPDALQIFTALNVPFGVSVIVEGWLDDRLSLPPEH